MVHPLGLAAKGAIWYLVAYTEGGLRTFRIDRVSSVEPTGERAVKLNGFDLAQAWRLITEEVDRKRTPVLARADAAPEMVPTLHSVLGNRLGMGPADDDGRVSVELRDHTVRSLAGEIAGFGAGLEVLDPSELRDALSVIGKELGTIYG